MPTRCERRRSWDNASAAEPAPAARTHFQLTAGSLTCFPSEQAPGALVKSCFPNWHCPQVPNQIYFHLIRPFATSFHHPVARTLQGVLLGALLTPLRRVQHFIFRYICPLPLATESHQWELKDEIIGLDPIMNLHPWLGRHKS